MQFRIADTFTDSLSRLTGDEQKVVKTTAFDLQLNPANPGMKFRRLSPRTPSCIQTNRTRLSMWGSQVPPRFAPAGRPRPPMSFRAF